MIGSRRATAVKMLLHTKALLVLIHLLHNLSDDIGPGRGASGGL